MNQDNSVNQDSSVNQTEAVLGQKPERRFKGYWIVLGMAVLIAIAGWIIWQGAPPAS